MTERLTERTALQRRCEAARRAGRFVGFVPTMGALHEGHMALVGEARRQGADFLVVSIFVNPLQFGEGEDLARYPRTLREDLVRCERAGVDVVFAPRPEAFYPPGFQSRVRLDGELVTRWEGACRPGHFEGVATVLVKLFSLVGPSMAVFGRKDFQQWRVVERLVADLDLPVRVHAHPTVRECDGLARSSRNRYLSESARERARAIPRALARTAGLWEAGERRVAALREALRSTLSEGVDTVDYAEVADAQTLEPLEGLVRPCTQKEAGPVLLVAARVEGTRLIDNLWLGVDASPLVS